MRGDEEFGVGVEVGRDGIYRYKKENGKVEVGDRFERKGGRGGGDMRLDGRKGVGYVMREVR
ncbi:hypothetical protein [Bacillus pumilus]|uniref:hypothetical protein n=1 Tax=Bacillus pumilus TaxID=1408 RepID=UPI0011A8892D|nr:hypothetical protein [Bacillus pumilus]